MMHNNSFRWHINLLILLTVLSIAGCNVLQNEAAMRETLTVAATQAPPTATHTPVATAIQTLVPIPTPLPTATLLPAHPLMITEMRKQVYPGSELVFEEMLSPGFNYDRYIVSYLSEGLKIYALLTIPQGEPPPTGWPVIIFNHGYIQPNLYRTTERYEAYVDGFAMHQYIVLRSDYRGHGSSEGEPTNTYGDPAYTVDVLNAVASVKTLPQADPERIGMWGHSMGGQITLRSMVITDDIKAGVIWAGVVASYPDLFEHWFSRRFITGPTPTPDPENPRIRWRIDFIETYGMPEENPDFWASISPNTFVADISGPIQLHHGTADDNVPHILSELLKADLEAVGFPTELNLYEDDNHNIANNFSLAMLYSIQFFDEHVKGYVP